MQTIIRTDRLDQNAHQRVQRQADMLQSYLSHICAGSQVDDVHLMPNVDCGTPVGMPNGLVLRLRGDAPVNPACVSRRIGEGLTWVELPPDVVKLVRKPKTRDQVFRPLPMLTERDVHVQDDRDCPEWQPGLCGRQLLVRADGKPRRLVEAYNFAGLYQSSMQEKRMFAVVYIGASTAQREFQNFVLARYKDARHETTYKWLEELCSTMTTLMRFWRIYLLRAMFPGAADTWLRDDSVIRHAQGSAYIRAGDEHIWSACGVSINDRVYAVICDPTRLMLVDRGHMMVANNVNMEPFTPALRCHPLCNKESRTINLFAKEDNFEAMDETVVFSGSVSTAVQQIRAFRRKDCFQITSCCEEPTTTTTAAARVGGEEEEEEEEEDDSDEDDDEADYNLLASSSNPRRKNKRAEEDAALIE